MKNGIVLILLVLLAAGCATMDNPEEVRKKHIEEFNQELEARNAEILKSPLSLQQCLGIALAENYSIKQAELNKRLAELDKDLAFSNFLPAVSVNTNLLTNSRTPMSMGMQMTDKTYRTFDVQTAMPILMPSIWLMYANRKLGISIAEIASHYVRQATTLEVTIAYYNCLEIEDTIGTLEVQVNAARSQSERINGLVKEGLAAAWHGEQAEYQHRARCTELSVARRNLLDCKGSLLKSMGMNPAGEIKLDRSGIGLDLPGQSESDMILTALEKHPTLSIADHQIVANENAVRIAICNFLPTVSGFVNGTWTSDSIADMQRYIYGGFSATWNIFSGFSHVAEYKAAKVRRQSSELDREATFISIILEVMKANRELANSSEKHQLAKMAYSTARAKFLEYEARQKEGLVTVNDMLDAQADMDQAQAVLARTTYQRHIALATLKMAMGVL